MPGVVFGSAGWPVSPWQAAQLCASACTSAALAAPVQNIPTAVKTVTNRRIDMAQPPHAYGTGWQHGDNAVNSGCRQGMWRWNLAGTEFRGNSYFGARFIALIAATHLFTSSSMKRVNAAGVMGLVSIA